MSGTIAQAVKSAGMTDAPAETTKSTAPAPKLSEAQKTFVTLFTGYLLNGAKQKLFAFIDKQDLATLRECVAVYFTVDIFPDRERSRGVFAHLAERIAGRSAAAALVVGVATKLPSGLWHAHYQELSKAEKSGVDKAVAKEKASLPRAQREFLDAFVAYMADKDATMPALVKPIVALKPADVRGCVRLYVEVSQAYGEPASGKSLDVFFTLSHYALKSGRSTFAIEYQEATSEPESIWHARFYRLDPARQAELNKKMSDAIAADAPPPGSRPGETPLSPLDKNQTNFLKLYRAYVDGGSKAELVAFQNALIKPDGDTLAGYVAVYLQDSALRYPEPASKRSLDVFYGTLSVAIAKSSSFYAIKVKSYIDANDSLWRRRVDALNILQYGNQLSADIDAKIKKVRFLDQLKVTFWQRFKRDPSSVELRAFDPVPVGPIAKPIDDALVDLDVAAGARSFEALDKAFSAVAAALEAQTDPLARWMLVRRIMERPRISVRFRHLAYMQGVGLMYLGCIQTYKELYKSGFDPEETKFFFHVEHDQDRYFGDFAAQIDATTRARGGRAPRLRDPEHPDWEPTGKNDDAYTLLAKAEGSLQVAADRMEFQLTPPLMAAKLRGCVEELWDKKRAKVMAMRISVDGGKAGKTHLTVGQTIGNVYILWWDDRHSTAYLQVNGYAQVVFEVGLERLARIYADHSFYGVLAENTKDLALVIPLMFQVIGYIPDLVSGGVTGLIKSILFNLAFERTMEGMGIDPTKAQLVLLGMALLHAGLEPKPEEPHLGTTPEPATPVGSVHAEPTATVPVQLYEIDAGHLPAPQGTPYDPQFYGLELGGQRSTMVPVDAEAALTSHKGLGVNESGLGRGDELVATPSAEHRSTGPSATGVDHGDTSLHIDNANRSTRPEDFSPEQLEDYYEDYYVAARSLEPEGSGHGVVPEADQAYAVGQSDGWFRNTRSGTSAMRRPDDVIQQSLNPDAVSTTAHAHEMVQSFEHVTGYEPPPAPSPLVDNGVPGSYYSSHAEIQQLRAHHESPNSITLGVNKDMCGCCRRAVRANAILFEREVVVIDPSYVRRFNPDGSVDVYPHSARSDVMRFSSADQPSVPVSAPASVYEGNPF